MLKSNIVSTLGSQDFQALGLSFDMSLSFEEAFLIPYYHTVPLSIAIPDRKLRLSGSGKVSFRNYIIKESEALHTIPPEDAAWFIGTS